MSVSLAMLPIALALRVVMGKKNFEAWVAAQQQRMETDISSEPELTRLLKKSGYDAVKYGSLIKTHIDGEKNFFFWELANGKWVAVFSKGDNLRLRTAFISRVEAVAGRQVFADTLPSEIEPVQTYPTNFVDPNLLAQALADLGGNPARAKDGSISCRINSAKLLFVKHGDGPYSVTIKGALKAEQAYSYLSDLDEDYKRAVQTDVYKRVISEAENNDLWIESEEILPDKSISLTLRFT